jgi:hypothetical protein
MRGRPRTPRQRKSGGVRDEKGGRRCLLLAPVVKYVDTFAFGDDGDGAAVFVGTHAAEEQSSIVVDWGCFRGAPEVHPEVLLGTLAPVVLLNLRIESNVIKPSSKEVSKTQQNTVSFVTRKRGGGTSMSLPSWQR